MTARLRKWGQLRISERNFFFPNGLRQAATRGEGYCPQRVNTRIPITYVMKALTCSAKGTPTPPEYPPPLMARRNGGWGLEELTFDFEG